MYLSPVLVVELSYALNSLLKHIARRISRLINGSSLFRTQSSMLPRCRLLFTHPSFIKPPLKVLTMHNDRTSEPMLLLQMRPEHFIFLEDTDPIFSTVVPNTADRSSMCAMMSVVTSYPPDEAMVVDRVLA